MNAVDRYCRIRLRPMRAGLWAMVLFLMMAGGGYAFDPPSPAGPVREIRIGMAAHDLDTPWSRESKEQGSDVCAEVILNPSLFQLLSATAYPSVGVSLNTRGDTSKVYGGFLLQWEMTPAFFFSTGLSLTLHNGKKDTALANRKSLGSRVLFRIPIEIGYALNRHQRIILIFDHVSNAGLASPNEGMDTLGLIYGYRF